MKTLRLTSSAWRSLALIQLMGWISPPGAVYAQANATPEVRELSQYLIRENIAGTYCSESATGPMPGFTRDATEQACQHVRQESLRGSGASGAAGIPRQD
ncbi:hypothetical protein GCM10007036_21490 [Alsobacter metallidurans]|uniref:UrcA family protein n=1 Tax=Alsobacter metallidurans TaxID=340221 RepID=A0A917MI48_9HYPH|nr:hypothetical protein GCM10007036_21490 [Alsobacter metallidurans]